MNNPTSCGDDAGAGSRNHRLRDGICNGVAPNVALDSGLNSTILQGFRVAPRAAQTLGGIGVAGGAVGLVCSYTDRRPASSSKLRKACRGLGWASTGLGAAALTPISAIPGFGWASGAVLGAGSVATGAGSAIACWKDPPDPNFKAVAMPKIGKVILPKRAMRRIPNRVRRPLAKFIQNGEAIRATGKALMHCEDRAAGAREAGDEVWEKRQQTCAGRYAAHLARLMTASKRTRKSLDKALRQAKVPSRVPPRMFRRQKTMIPQKVHRSLKRGGATGQQIKWTMSQLNDALKGVQPPRRAFDLIAGPEVLRSLTYAAAGFKELSRSYR